MRSSRLSRVAGGPPCSGQPQEDARRGFRPGREASANPRAGGGVRMRIRSKASVFGNLLDQMGPFASEDQLRGGSGTRRPAVITCKNWMFLARSAAMERQFKCLVREQVGRGPLKFVQSEPVMPPGVWRRSASISQQHPLAQFTQVWPAAQSANSCPPRAPKLPHGHRFHCSGSLFKKRSLCRRYGRLLDRWKRW